MIPLNAAAVATLVRVGFAGRFDPWLRLIALATLLEHGTGVCYANWDRYHLVTWLLTALVAIVWLREEGLPWIRKRKSGIRNQPAIGLYGRCLISWRLNWTSNPATSAAPRARAAELTAADAAATEPMARAPSTRLTAKTRATMSGTEKPRSVARW